MVYVAENVYLRDCFRYWRAAGGEWSEFNVIWYDETRN